MSFGVLLVMRNPRNFYIFFVIAIYIIAASTWIVLSDALMADFVTVESALWFSVAKGMFFVGSTAVLFLFALRKVPNEDNLPRFDSLSDMITALLTQKDGTPAMWIYGLALVLPMAALLLRLGMPSGEHYDHELMLELFMFPIILIALLGGLGPGVLCTLFTGALIFSLMHLMSYPDELLFMALLSLSFLLLNGLLVSALSGSLRQSVLRARHSKALLEVVIGGTSDAVFVKDSKGRYLLANPVVADFLGRDITDIIGKSDTELFDHASANKIQSNDRHVFETKAKLVHEERLCGHGGQTRIWSITKGPMLDDKGQVTGLFGIAHDITTLRQTWDALQNSEERFRLTLEATSDGFWDWNVSTGEVFRSAGYMQVMDHPPDADTHDFAFFSRVLHPDDKEWVHAAVMAHLKGETSAIRFECRIVTAEQAVRWIKARGRAITRNAQGYATRVLGTIQNITDAQRSTQDLQLVLNEAYEAIWITSADGQFLYANPAACAMCGYTLPALQQLRIFDLMTAEDQANIAQHVRALDQHKFIRREWPLLRQDGQVVSVDVLTERLPDGRIIGFGRDLSDEKKMFDTLHQRELQLARVLDGSDQGFWDWHLPSNTLSISPRFASMLGYERPALEKLLQNWSQLIHEEDLPHVSEAIKRHRHGLSTHIESVFRMRRADGVTYHWILSRGRIVEHAADGTPLIMSGTHTDYNERKASELLMQQALVVFKHVQEAILITDPDGQIRQVNPAFEHMTGYTEAEVIGKNPSFMTSKRHSSSFFTNLFQVLSDKGCWQGEIWNADRKGRVYPCRLSISEVRDTKGVLQLYVGVLTDITKDKTHEQELYRIAHHDLLTGLPNRLLLGQELERALIQSQLEDQHMAVCFLDLDGFKAINDHYGHHVGDRLLMHIADKLRAVLRKGDVLARPGGDEFVVLLSNLDQPNDGHRLAEQLLASIQSTVRIEGHDLAVSASMGMTFYPSDPSDTDTLLRHADHAMYAAKELGKNRCVVFDPIHDRQLQALREVQKRLQQAHEQQEFVLFYQPKVDLSDGRVIGAEALIRWQHPERGLLPPGEFVHALENSFLERLVGEWVITRALQQLCEWQRQALGMHLQVSVNIGAGHLLHPGFVEFLQVELARYDTLDAHQLELEILETAGLADMDRAIEVLTQCQRLGISFALDDFGTGYSSLAYFRKLPVQMIKIDQSFVRNMLNEQSDFDIVESVVRLTQAFKRPVIAEGVETVAHGLRLLNMGCHLAQGYGIAKPMPADALPNWIAHWQKTAPWKQWLIASKTQTE